MSVNQKPLVHSVDVFIYLFIIVYLSPTQGYITNKRAECIMLNSNRSVPGKAHDHP